MNLEQRVQALEQEVELLKAQVQATLLDIQEQLLNNTYPTLRAEPSSHPTAPAPEPHAAPQMTALPVKRVVFTESQPDDDRDFEQLVEEMPVVRKVVPVEQPTQPSIPARDEWEEANFSNEREANAYDWIALEKWVSEKVERLGIERTRELVHLYARQERFTRQERTLLLEFVDIYDDGDPKPPAPAKPERPSKQPTAHPTIVPQTRAVVDEIRAELREKRAKSIRKQEMPKEELSEQQGLVLRLIAGILNAGDEADPAPSNGHRKY